MKKLLCIAIALVMGLAGLAFSGCDFLNRIPEDDEVEITDDFVTPDEPDYPDEPDHSVDPEGPGSFEENPETLFATEAEKRDLYEGTYSTSSDGSYYGVGRTLNVIEDPFIEVASGYKKVFDPEKLLALNWRKTRVGKMEASSQSAESMEELFSSLNEEFQSFFSSKVDSDVFSASLKKNFGFAAGSDYEETSNEIFYTASQIYSASLVEIDEYFDYEQFEDVLSDEVLEDAVKVQKGTMDPSTFISLYGTHAVLAGYYGGKIECNYYLRNTGSKWKETTVSSFETGISTGISDLISRESEEAFSMQADYGLDREETEEVFSANGIGGANFSALSMSDFLSNYHSWTDSMNDSEDLGIIVGLPKRSLVAIWDMLPSQYAEAKAILNTYFETAAESTESDFLKLYERYYSDPIDRGDTENFAGGHGTLESPYLIESDEHFQNIQNIDAAGKYFKLNNSISLGSWNTPFSFDGILDGDGHTIEYFQRPTSKDEYLAGLFTQLNGATVKNLYLDATISRTEKSGTGTIGTLAGEAIGNTTVSRVAVDGKIYDESGSGLDYVGGLLGAMFGGTIDQCEVVCDIDIIAKHARGGGIVGYVVPQDLPVMISNSCFVGELLASSNYIVNNGVRIAGGIIGRAKGDGAFEISIQDCYHSGLLELKWVGWAAYGAGTHGCGGVIGQFESGKEDGISVEGCYWTGAETKLSGNTKELNEGCLVSSLTGIAVEWNTDIWTTLEDGAPKLSWIKE